MISKSSRKFKYWLSLKSFFLGYSFVFPWAEIGNHIYVIRCSDAPPIGKYRSQIVRSVLHKPGAPILRPANGKLYYYCLFLFFSFVVFNKCFKICYLYRHVILRNAWVKSFSPSNTHLSLRLRLAMVACNYIFNFLLLLYYADSLSQFPLYLHIINRWKESV